MIPSGMPRPPHYPSAFHFCIGGYFGGYETWKLREGQVVICKDDHKHEPEEYCCCPSAADWQIFWETIEELGVWQWQRRYDTPGILDGTDWSLTLRYEKQRLRTSGCNGYPQAKGAGSTYERSGLEAFVQALGRLTGKTSD